MHTLPGVCHCFSFRFHLLAEPVCSTETSVVRLRGSLPLGLVRGNYRRSPAMTPQPSTSSLAPNPRFQWASGFGWRFFQIAHPQPSLRSGARTIPLPRSVRFTGVPTVQARPESSLSAGFGFRADNFASRNDLALSASRAVSRPESSLSAGFGFRMAVFKSHILSSQNGALCAARGPSHRHIRIDIPARAF